MNQLVNETITVENTVLSSMLVLKIKTSILDRKFTVYIKIDVKQDTKRNEKCINSCIVHQKFLQV